MARRLRRKSTARILEDRRRRLRLRDVPDGCKPAVPQRPIYGDDGRRRWRLAPQAEAAVTAAV